MWKSWQPVRNVLLWLASPCCSPHKRNNRDEDVEVLAWQPVRISCDLPHPVCPHPWALAARLLEGTRGHFTWSLVQLLRAYTVRVNPMVRDSYNGSLLGPVRTSKLILNRTYVSPRNCRNIGKWNCSLQKVLVLCVLCDKGGDVNKWLSHVLVVLIKMCI